jgi:hypothetical protein
MLRKIMIMLAGVAFLGAVVLSTTAEAQRGGGGGMRGGGFGGGMRAGGFGGGMRAGGFGGGMRAGGFHRGGFVGHRGFVGSRFASRGHFVRPGFHRFHHRPFFAHRFRHRPFFAHRFHHRRFAFAAVPFVVGASFYDDPCWVVRYTYWGPRYVNICGYGYY